MARLLLCGRDRAWLCFELVYFYTIIVHPSRNEKNGFESTGDSQENILIRHVNFEINTISLIFLRFKFIRPEETIQEWTTGELKVNKF